MATDSELTGVADCGQSKSRIALYSVRCPLIAHSFRRTTMPAQRPGDFPVSNRAIQSAPTINSASHVSSARRIPKTIATMSSKRIPIVTSATSRLGNAPSTHTIVVTAKRCHSRNCNRCPIPSLYAMTKAGRPGCQNTSRAVCETTFGLQAAAEAMARRESARRLRRLRSDQSRCTDADGRGSPRVSVAVPYRARPLVPALPFGASIEGPFTPPVPAAGGCFYRWTRRRRSKATPMIPESRMLIDEGSGMAWMLSTPSEPNVMGSPIVDGETELRMPKSTTFAKSLANGCGELIPVKLPAASENIA